MKPEKPRWKTIMLVVIWAGATFTAACRSPAELRQEASESGRKCANLRSRGRYAASAEACRRALDAGCAAVGREHPFCGMAHFNLGLALVSIEDPDRQREGMKHAQMAREVLCQAGEEWETVCSTITEFMTVFQSHSGTKSSAAVAENGISVDECEALYNGYVREEQMAVIYGADPQDMGHAAERVLRTNPECRAAFGAPSFAWRD